MPHPNSTPEHEALCRRCGRCCYEKFIIDGHVFNSRRPCPHLDTATNLCRAYAQRFRVNPRCLDVPKGIRLGIFPADCPYVRNLPDYVPPEDGWLDDEVIRKIERGLLFNCEDVREEMRRRGTRREPKAEK